MFILQNEFGNDGYAFWYKLKELLCCSNGHVYDYNNPATWRLLLAKTNVSEVIAKKILNVLADISAIDKDLFEHKIIWMQSLVDDLEILYVRRQGDSAPKKPIIANKNGVIVDINQDNADNNTQSKEKKTIEKNNIYAQNDQDYEQAFEQFWSAYPKKKSKQEAQKSFNKLKPDAKLLATMLEKIERSKQSQDWLKESGQFIPYPATWLNQRRWEDEDSPAPRGKLPSKYKTPAEIYAEHGGDD